VALGFPQLGVFILIARKVANALAPIMKVMPFDIGMLRNAKLCCCVSQILPKGDVVTDDEHALACSEQLRGTRRQHNRLSTSRGPLYSTITAGRPRCCQLT